MIIHKLKQRLTGQFTRNIGWLGVAELVNRVVRLGTTVTLARLFNPHEYGLMAIIYTIHGFAEVFTLKAGVTGKIVHAEERELESICQTSYSINWLFCIFLFIAHCALAYPISIFYEEPELILPLCAVGTMYLAFPIFLVQSALIQRENRLKIIALGNAAALVTGNLVTICLAFIGLGIWAIVCSMILSTLPLIIIYYRNHSWRPSKNFTLKKWRDVSSFGGSILGIELLDKIRLNLDYLLVGRFLGVEALGMYFFAFNAGLGISQSIINAIISALFPYLCVVRNNFKQLKVRYFSSLKTIGMVVVPLVLLQSSLAPVYVPVVFGSKWNSAIPILIIICLSAIPLALSLSTYQLLNAVGKIRLTLQWNIIYTIVFASALLLAVKWGALSVAITVLTCQLLTLLFSYWALQNVFKASK